MAKETINVIDIRSDKVICLVAQEIQLLDKGKLTQLIGVGVSRFPVTCQKPLAIENISLKQHISEAVKAAEDEASATIDNVTISVSENMVSQYLTYETNCLEDKITSDDIKSFFSSKEFSDLYTSNNEPLHSFPISYKVDSNKTVSDPVGLLSETLTTTWHIVSVSKDFLRKIHNIFSELDINVYQTVSSFYASSLAALKENESDLGSICIDIQKNQTCLSYTFDNQLIGFDTVKIGTFHFANDISQIKSISIEDAELYRKKYDAHNFDKKRNLEDEQIYQIYLSRAEELAEVIFSLIQRSRFRDLTENNIILTGYGSKSQIFNKVFNLKLRNSNFRVGATLKLNGPKTYIDNPSFTSSCGLLIYVVNHDLEGSKKENNIKKRSIISAIYRFFRSL